MTNEFAGRVAVVTGAGGGMGLAIAQDLLAADAAVVGIDLKDKPPALADAGYEQGDVSDDGFVGAAIARAAETHGRLDCLVNAAGVLLFDQDQLARRDRAARSGSG